MDGVNGNINGANSIKGNINGNSNKLLKKQRSRTVLTKVNSRRYI